jgi:hypothetical protein
MSPLRGDVLGVAFVFALPLFALWWRGDLSVDDVTGRLPWCFLAGWAVVAVLRYAATSRSAGNRHRSANPAVGHPETEEPLTGEPAPTS